MKQLYDMLNSELMNEFDEESSIFHLQNFKLENSQMTRMTEMNQFNFPTIFYTYNTTEWNNLGFGIRHAVVSFDLNFVIERYIEVEDSQIIEEYATAIINKVCKLSSVDNKYSISQPWLKEQIRGQNETNLISLNMTFNCNVTDFTYINPTYAFLAKVDMNVAIDPVTIAWILYNGSWNDNYSWWDNQPWND